ncbi:uncharacterized protein LOC110434822 [Sorghum bicolor]|uniref:uncharacterized protein LOC110434822 n=1 Tax=Sorghum bicolor TaxID=4558 RepID=UPI000B426D54|nr:uncharacterized protein LOC110434822 [Sorghum bicolor]|eukprot:XP_021315234.1 uncharacterized protein LOC110434822 [Sorghum bicolor]
MHYEERITLTIKYYAEHLSQKINKAEARQSLLTQEQFLEMIPWWCASYADCWEKIVNSWFVPGVAEDRDSHRDRAKQKQDPTHHQGSSSLSGYQKNGRLRMVAGLCQSSRHMEWPARQRRLPMSPSTWMTRPRRTATRASTHASLPMRLRLGRFGQTGIRAPMTLMGRWS